VSVKFGVWYDFRNPARWRRPYDALYRENLEQIAFAEELGFESVWLSEHHVTDDGYLPSLFPMLAAVVERTRTMRLGSAIMLAPFQHPIRFAEDAAVIDQLSGGRLELGLGLGYRTTEFEALAVPRDERARRTVELVEVARLAWSGEPFDYSGRHFSFQGIEVTPPPFRPGGPPLWLAGANPAAAKRAGRLGCRFMPDAQTPTEVLNVYRRTHAEHGHDPSEALVALNPPVYVCDDPERGWDEVKEHFLYAFNRYRRWFAEADGRSFEPLVDADALPRERYLVGTPEQVAESIRALAERTRCDRLFFWARPPGLSLEASSRSLELFAREVVPRVADAMAG
jgi:alkanesulfonate monooxygenase SsuD/methylene tetrahydromethanopterin reductase-like flavin-dependent oxidoreductase (luciferase family)